jgi:hypothetical protein
VKDIKNKLLSEKKTLKGTSGTRLVENVEKRRRDWEGIDKIGKRNCNRGNIEPDENS